MKRGTTSIVIPLYNGAGTIGSVLEGIMKQRVPSPPEIVCIDSGSTDGTTAIARRFPIRLITIKPDSFRHGGTRNLGARESKGDRIVFLTQDSIPANSEWLEALTTAVERDANAAGAYSRQVPGPSCHPFVADRLERWAAGRMETRIQEPLSPRDLAGLPLAERLERIAFDDVSSCILRQVWEKIPFPDKPFGEDVWWARDVLFSGHSIVFEPRSVVIHDHPWNPVDDFLRIVRDHASLCELLGDPFVPSPWRAISLGLQGIGTFRRIAHRSGKTPVDRLKLKLLSGPYSLSQALAQYLGWVLCRYGNRAPRANRNKRGTAPTIH